MFSGPYLRVHVHVAVSQWLLSSITQYEDVATSRVTVIA